MNQGKKKSKKEIEKENEFLIKQVKLRDALRKRRDLSGFMKDQSKILEKTEIEEKRKKEEKKKKKKSEEKVISKDLDLFIEDEPKDLWLQIKSRNKFSCDFKINDLALDEDYFDMIYIFEGITKKIFVCHKNDLKVFSKSAWSNDSDLKTDFLLIKGQDDKLRDYFPCLTSEKTITILTPFGCTLLEYKCENLKFKIGTHGVSSGSSSMTRIVFDGNCFRLVDFYLTVGREKGDHKASLTFSELYGTSFLKDDSVDLNEANSSNEYISGPIGLFHEYFNEERRSCVVCLKWPKEVSLKDRYKVIPNIVVQKFLFGSSAPSEICIFNNPEIIISKPRSCFYSKWRNGSLIIIDGTSWIIILTSKDLGFIAKIKFPEAVTFHSPSASLSKEGILYLYCKSNPNIFFIRKID